MLGGVATEETYSRWAEEARLLAEVGKWLFAQPTTVQIRLPRSIAAVAVASWERDGDEGPLAPETYLQRAVRHQAGTLALIGLCIQKGGVEDGEDIVVSLPSWYVGLALEAADEMGLIRGGAPPKG